MSTLEEHLSEDVAVILVIIGIVDGKPHVLLVHRSATPQEGKFALPGGKWKRTESLESSALQKLVQETELPVVAIGGIGAENLNEVRSTGVQSICIVSSITMAVDPEESARLLVDIWNSGG